MLDLCWQYTEPEIPNLKRAREFDADRVEINDKLTPINETYHSRQ
jgi:hypothetical protein